MSQLEVRFIRHATGTHMANLDVVIGLCHDAELTDNGKRDAFQKGEELKRRGYVPDRVVASSAIRCMQTARFLLKGMRLDRQIEPTEELWEMDHGPAVGQLKSDVYTPDVLAQIARDGKNFALPGGQSMNQVGRRGINWLHQQESLAARAGKSMAIMAIAHVGLITHTVGQLKNWSQAESRERLRMMDPLAETDLIYDAAGWQLTSFARPPQ